MLRPKLPVMPQPTGLVTPPALMVAAPAVAVVEPTAVTPGRGAVQQSAPVAPTAPASSRPVVQLTPGFALVLVGAGTAVVLVVGVVLVSLLLAVAITGASVAVCAVVMRSLLNSQTTHRR